MLTHKELKARGLERTDVKAEYDRLDEELHFLDEFPKARAVDAVAALQRHSADQGMEQIAMEEIDVEIKAARKKRTARGTK